eukprot:Pompholyxophrys_punicea_v1_NODE_64_length_3937_cov_2.858836.p7 type:complete len:123 gc:universal NODE_64_length_3937_cov_2.858836:1972-1604(-)
MIFSWARNTWRRKPWHLAPPRRRCLRSRSGTFGSFPRPVCRPPGRARNRSRPSWPRPITSPPPERWPTGSLPILIIFSAYRITRSSPSRAISAATGRISTGSRRFRKILPGWRNSWSRPAGL